MHNYFDLIASLIIMALALSLAVPSVLESSIQVVEVQNVESQPGDTRAMMLLNDPGEPEDWGLSINAPARVGLSSSGALTPSTLDPLKVARLDPANKYYTRYSLSDARYQQGYHESIATDTEDFVDSNTSDVDSSADRGTHSNFANQQAGPDSVYDTLTEATIPNEDWRFAVSEGESTWSTDTSYQTKVTLTFTPPTQAYYLIIATAEIGGSSTSYNINARLNVDGSYYGESVDRPFNTGDYFTWSGIKILELTSTSHTVRIEYATGTAGYAVKIRNARIIAMQVDKGGTSFYKSTEPADSSTTATSYTDIATLTWTPTSPGYWLILSVGYIRCSSTSYQNYANLVVNGTQYAEDSWRPFSTSSSIRHCFSSHEVAYLNTTAPTTLKIQMYTTGGTLYYYGVKLYAVDLTGLGATFDYAISEAQSSWNTNTNWQDKVTVNFNSPAANTPYLIVASGTIWESSTSYQAKAQVIVDGATVVGQQLKYPRNTADRVNFMVSKEYNFTQGSHNVKIQYATSSTSGTVYIRNARVTVIKLPLYTATNNYELDLEAQWTSVDYHEAYELLCIYTGNLGGEPLRVDYWTGSSWSNLITGLTPNGWNNVSVPLTNSTFTIRFKGGTETGDPVQNSWQVDAVLLHCWSVPNVKGNLGIPDDEGFYLTIKPVYDVSVDFTNQTTIIPYNPSNYSLLSSTQLVSGSASSLNSSDDAYMTLRSYYTSDTGTNVQDYVDNISNVDGSPDKGTHSNFLGEQAGPDLINDTLTESAGSPTTLTIRPDGIGAYSEFGTVYPGGSAHWETVDEVTPDEDSSYIETSSTSDQRDSFSLSNATIPTGSTINWVRVYVRIRNTEAYVFQGAGETMIRTYGSNYFGTSQTPGTSYTNYYTEYTNNPYTGSAWTISEINSLEAGCRANDGTFNYSHIRCTTVWVEVNYTPPCQLDLEVQWTSVDYDQANEELCIYTGNLGSENLQVDVWTGSWTTVIPALSANQWNNVSVSSYLTSSTFTIRFKGTTESGDTTQDQWQIDAVLLHVRTTGPPGYKLEAEFSGSSNSATWSQLNWTVESAWNISSVTVKLQLYDYQTGNYPPTSGDGYISYVSSATPNIDENKTQTITSNPTRFKDASGSWKVRLTAVKEGGSPFDCRIDWVEFKVATGFASVQVTRGNIPVSDARVNLFMVSSAPGGNMTGTTDSRGEVEIPISPPQGSSGVSAVVAFAHKDGLTGFGWDTFPISSPTFDTLTEGNTGGGSSGDTGYKNPSANTGDFLNPTNAYSDDGNSAQTPQNISLPTSFYHKYYNNNFNIPSGSTIDGIEVRVDGRSGNLGLTSRFKVRLSWDGGSTWTSQKATPNLGTSEETHYLGGSTDKWGRTWSDSELSNANFRLEVEANADDGGALYVFGMFLEWVTVKVYYTGPNYKLDLEVQFTNVDYSQANEELSIYAGELGSEDILVQFWNGSGWSTLLTDLTPNSWNTVPVNLTNNTFTIRFKGGTETGDTVQDSWEICDVKLHVWTGENSWEDYVDNISNVDGSPDVGTHSNFENEKTFGQPEPIPGKCFVASSDLYLYTDTSVPGFTVSNVTFYVVTPYGLLQPKTLDYGTPGTGVKLHSVDFSEWNAVPTPAVIWVYVETVRSGNDWYTYAIQGYPVNGQISYGLYPKAVTRTETFQTYVTIQGVVYEATYVYWKGYREA